MASRRVKVMLLAHLTEHGIAAPRGVWNLLGIRRLINDAGDSIEPLVVEMSRLTVDSFLKDPELCLLAMARAAPTLQQ